MSRTVSHPFSTLLSTWAPRHTRKPSGQRRSRRQWAPEGLEDRVLLAATIYTVNAITDTGAGSGTTGDLRYCINQANANPNKDGNLIQFAVTGTIALDSALPELSNTAGLIDIEGPGAANLTVARSTAKGTPAFRIFTIDAGVRATLDSLTITGGHVEVNGGGIYNQGDLTITSSTISANGAGDLEGVWKSARLRRRRAVCS